ncbi:calcium/calmodulin dependent protein kinase II association-domain-containing protein [Chytriomyces sp. MP71]|nr:calcium/calmodulin dependent protein kinase II association-domain-containing protein [Chytriomyces sp. MP71]
MDAQLATVLSANKTLLDAAVAGDWAKYETLVSPDITCFEPEAGSHLVKGLDFHQFYFPEKAPSTKPNKTTTLVNPHVSFLSADKTAALVSYVRLTQYVGADGKPVTSEMSETRVWSRSSSASADWKNVHFHRGCYKL